MNWDKQLADAIKAVKQIERYGRMKGDVKKEREHREIAEKLEFKMDLNHKQTMQLVSAVSVLMGERYTGVET